jgi:hypothetical protein
VLWLPTKLVAHLFRPVTATLDSLGEFDNQTIDDYLKENPL